MDRGTKDAEAVLRLTRETAEGKPAVLVIDGLFAYEKASHGLSAGAVVSANVK